LVFEAPPAVALEGDNEVAVGTGLFTENVSAFDGPPPGVGFDTVTLSVPAMATSDAGTVAVNLPLFTKAAPSAARCRLSARERAGS
jgi:hypothetical protein